MALGIFFLTGCYKTTEEVLQGRLISYDAKIKVMKIDDELTKESDETPIHMGEALEEGLPPVGGVIRVSYIVKNGKKVALRVVDLERAIKLFKLKK